MIKPPTRHTYPPHLNEVEALLARLGPDMGSTGRLVFDRSFDDYRIFKVLQKLRIENYIVRMHTGNAARDLVAGQVLPNRDAVLKVTDGSAFPSQIDRGEHCVRIGRRDVGLAVDGKVLTDPIRLTLVVAWAPEVPGVGRRHATNWPHVALLCSPRLRGRDAALRAYQANRGSGSFRIAFAGDGNVSNAAMPSSCRATFLTALEVGALQRRARPRD